MNGNTLSIVVAIMVGAFSLVTTLIVATWKLGSVIADIKTEVAGIKAELSSLRKDVDILKMRGRGY